MEGSQKHWEFFLPRRLLFKADSKTVRLPGNLLVSISRSKQQKKLSPILKKLLESEEYLKSETPKFHHMLV